MRKISFLLMILMLGTLRELSALDIYVSATGSDINDGTKENPVATLSYAIRMAREKRRLNDPSIKNGIHIILDEGVYQVSQPVIIRPDDSGTDQSPTYIESAAGESAVLSGGFQITGWRKPAGEISGLPEVARGNVWVADVPVRDGMRAVFRQIWVNGQKAVRAKSSNGDLMDRILDWNKTEQSCVIPTLRFDSLEQATGLEMFIHQWWEIAILRIKKLEIHGDSTKLFFWQPESKIQNEHPWPAPWLSDITGNSAFYLTNSIRFLDEPGEWYLDADHQKLYYWPRTGENLSTARVIAPALENIIRFEGNIDNTINHIYFRNISFEYTGWLRPSEKGHVPLQTGMFLTEAYKLRPAGTKEKKTLENQAWVGRPAAAVEVNFSKQISFENCRFEHLASTGLDFYKGAKNNSAVGSLFKDIGGSAILAGMFSDESMEAHLPYLPKDERVVCDSVVIENNLITNVSNEDWGTVGIGLGYVRDARVRHNEIEDVSYTGISMGWGWTPAPNVMRNNIIAKNKIHHYGKHNYDCAGIYTMSAQPNSQIIGNYVDSIYKAPYAHLPSHWFYLYTDEGSSYLTIKDNWTPSEKYLRNANGPGNIWQNNGPQVDDAIKMQAGLQPSYRYLLKDRTTQLDTIPVNVEHREVIELVYPSERAVNIREIRAFLSENNMDTRTIYQWKNHVVVYEKIDDVFSTTHKLQKAFPMVKVKWYADLIYDFHRQNCDGSPQKEGPWKNIVMTADLVPDKKMQQEYIDDHKSQFRVWPEVSRGFCNAQFQQVQVFKRDRQLMLVISIPEGSNFEKLNAETTKNNPRVVEWNQLMSKYQQGIEGTKKGETWVQLKER